MSAQSFEITLARLYTEDDFREEFLSNPLQALQACQLTELEKEELLKIDRAGLILASMSFAHKRQKRSRQKFHLRVFQILTGKK